jgi:hypothetical protein
MRIRYASHQQKKGAAVKIGSSITALFPAAHQAELAAQELRTLGARPGPIETESRGEPMRESGVSRTSLAIAVTCLAALALATLIFPGVGYLLSIVGAVTVWRVRPAELEHRLEVRDEVLTQGGAVLLVSNGSLSTPIVVRLLQRHGAIDIHEHHGNSGTSRRNEE